MLSKTSVDEVFMHYFEKMSSASVVLAPRPPPGSCPWTQLGDFSPSDPLIAHPWKKFLRAPMHVSLFKRLYEHLLIMCLVENAVNTNELRRRPVH